MKYTGFTALLSGLTMLCMTGAAVAEGAGRYAETSIFNREGTPQTSGVSRSGTRPMEDLLRSYGVQGILEGDGFVIDRDGTPSGVIEDVNFPGFFTGDSGPYGNKSNLPNVFGQLGKWNGGLGQIAAGMRR